MHFDGILRHNILIFSKLLLSDSNLRCALINQKLNVTYRYIYCGLKVGKWIMWVRKKIRSGTASVCQSRIQAPQYNVLHLELFCRLCRVSYPKGTSGHSI